jgi:outer membrane lipoprotein SlyB
MGGHFCMRKQRFARTSPAMCVIEEKRTLQKRSSIDRGCVAATSASAGPVARAAVGPGAGAIVAGPVGGVAGGAAGVAVSPHRGHHLMRHHRVRHRRSEVLPSPSSNGRTGGG